MEKKFKQQCKLTRPIPKCLLNHKKIESESFRARKKFMSPSSSTASFGMSGNRNPKWLTLLIQSHTAIFSSKASRRIQVSEFSSEYYYTSWRKTDCLATMAFNCRYLHLLYTQLTDIVFTPRIYYKYVNPKPSEGRQIYTC